MLRTIPKCYWVALSTYISEYSRVPAAVEPETLFVRSERLLRGGRRIWSKFPLSANGLAPCLFWNRWHRVP